jgi:phosphate/sulfate permease
MYSIIVVILVLLAVSVLIVGISNDAVNFLNGALGSKAASLRIILAIAAAGILVGVTFSNGMMEVARKGLFNPAAFSYKDVMIIFIAVMLTNVLLLDLFNTFGLPTSTTVSIVFEILGAAMGLAIIKIANTTGDWSEMSNFINSQKAFAIISGILISIIIAFSLSAIIQWLSRLLFTFNFEKNLKYYGGFFGGLAITCILYFILIKGLNDSLYAHRIVSSVSLNDWLDFIARQDFEGFKSLAKTLQNSANSDDLVKWGNTLNSCNKDTFTTSLAEFSKWAISNADLSMKIPLYFTQFVNFYTWQILVFGFIITSAVLQLLYWLFNFNILKFIVLVGTFAMAQAFAANDLVNFIGVPLAGLAAHQDFIASSASNAEHYMMGALMNPVSIPTMFLLVSGLIMVITLWLSKKAKTVIKTSLSLSDQNIVHERFESNAMAREIVRVAIRIGNFFSRFIPAYFKKKISQRFVPVKYSKKANKQPGVSFDLVRASVTLVVSSALIAFGTSIKLPLSTTYVTFMVAMGASLADGAWDRESAVYRVTGVITVIGGWFFTAFCAFTLTLLIAVFIYLTWWVGVFLMFGLILFLLTKSHFLYRARSKEDNLAMQAETSLFKYGEGLYDFCGKNVLNILFASSKLFDECIDNLNHEKRKKLKEILKAVKKLNDKTKKLKKRVPEVFKILNEDSIESGHYYSKVIDYTREAMHCLEYITAPAFKHVDNNHKPLTAAQIKWLNEISFDLSNYFNLIIKDITDAEFKNAVFVTEESQQLCEKITMIKKKQLKLLKKEPGSSRTNILFFDMIDESKNLILNINNMYKSFRDFSESSKRTVYPDNF